MNSWHQLKKESSITDIEKQSGFQNDEGDSGKKMTNINPKWELILKCWSWMFVLVGVIVVLCVDPLFFYLPVINKNSQCIKLDDRLKNAATYLRLFFDTIFFANMIFRFFFHHKSNLDENRATPEFKKKCFRYLDLVIDILALLPIPQVLVPIIFKKMRSSKLLDTRKILKTIVLLQYVPRVVRIYLSWMKLIKSSKTLARRIWIKAAFNFFVYILTSHVLGAFWYFLSIERQTTCWYKACKVDSACIPSSFTCGRKLQNNTFLDDFCRVQTPSNTTQFDFGIYREALESGIVSSTNIAQKIMYCFWWGLRNLSSLGQNLETSNYTWENFFSIFILIFGLLLVLYFIGSVETYIQMITEKATKKSQMEAEKSEEIDRQMTIKKLTIRLWISRNQIPDSMKERIFSCVKQTLEGNKDFDTEKPIRHLSDKDLLKEIKLHLCLPLLRKVECLKNEKEYLLQLICEFLKPLYYNEDNYIIREGEPMNAMLFITQGSIWCFKTNNGEDGEGPQCIEKGEFYGEELLEWGFKFNGSASPKPSDFPISTKTVKTFTKVEAFALTANDLKILVARHSCALSNAKMKFTQAARRRLKEKKNENSTAEQ